MLDVSEPQMVQLTQVLLSYPNVIANTPGRTTLVQHYITVGDTVPVQQKPYRIHYSQRELEKQELDHMFKARVIRPSTVPGLPQLCQLQRREKSNKVARFDAYLMPRIGELIDTVGPVKIISTLNLAKDY